MNHRYGIWEEIKRIQDNINHIFERMLEKDFLFGERSDYLLEPPRSRDLKILESNYMYPLCDMYETDKSIVYEIEIPGVNKNDIKVTFDNDKMEIRAETKSEKKEQDKKRGMYRFERTYSGFYRTFPLPQNGDINKAEAEYINGVLKISIPKTKTENKKKELEIK